MKKTMAQKFYNEITMNVNKERAQAHTECNRLDVAGTVEKYTFSDSSSVYFDSDDHAFYLGYR